MAAADTHIQQGQINASDPALRECHDCGLFQHLPALPAGQVAQCVRCDATLRRRVRRSFLLTAALMFTGIALFVVILAEQLIGITLLGREQTTYLATMPFAFEQFGMWELAFVVLLFTLLIPLGKVVLTTFVIVGLRYDVDPVTLATAARVRAWLGPWAMVEVLMLGMLVAYTRLIAYATVEIGPALYALAALVLVTCASDAWLDEHAFWEEIARRRKRPEPGIGQPIGCDTCGHVTVGRVGDLCFCCDSHLRIRKHDPIRRCWALVLSAAALYIPSNLLPVMTIVRLGQNTTSTILGGVEELIAAQMWPLALLVFTASIIVPMTKLILLIYMLIATQRRSPHNLKQRTSIYRLVEVIGRWSMIDVFMITILTALVRMGFLASVIPENGAICFAGVVIITMLASFSFDPRVMWDVAEEREAVQGAVGQPA